MYLKKIEICGFKSFADKIKLDFEQGITAIIGPNGCGKSNVADAVRWCLGEQSAHSLRSRQMMDVIFNGSQSRSITGMAEVSITFDNSQNLLPIDYSEVTVTRRLFRSGESEYFMNKTQCRLKDVRDMFLDTGIGTEGYAVMEQGKVEFVLSAKPEERRELFEEAAGVSKYKVRREETLRKLEKIDIDMNRVNDMLALLKEQISSLDAAARKARQYKKYQEDLKRFEIANLVKNVTSHQAEIDNINLELVPKTEEFEKFNTSLNQIDSEISQIRLLQTEKDETYIKLQDDFSNIKSDISLSDERIQSADAREKELLERQADLKNEIKNYSELIKKHETEIASITRLCDEINEQVIKLEKEYKEKEAQLNEIRSVLFNANNEENIFKNRLFELNTEKSKNHNEQNRLNSYQSHCQVQILSLQKDLNRFNEKLTPVKEQIARFEKDLSESEAVNSQTLEMQENLRSKMTKLEDERAKIANTILALKESIVSIESRRQTLLEIEMRDPRKSAARSVLSMGFQGLRGPIRDLITIDDVYQDIVIEALGEKLDYLVSDTVESANAAIKYLEENNLGRVTFLVLERLPENIHTSTVIHLPGARSLISMIRYDQTLEKALTFLCGETLVSGNTIYGYAVLQGGGQINLDETLKINTTMVKDLEKELLSKKNELDKLIDVTKNLSCEIEQLTAQMKQIDTNQQRLAFTLEMQRKQIGTIKQDEEYMEKEIQITREELSKNENEESKTKDNLKTFVESLSNIENEEKEIKSSQQQLLNRLSELNRKESELAPILTESKVAWATQVNELTSRKREDETLKETLVTVKERLGQFHKEFEANKLKLEEQKDVQANESDKLKEFYKKQEKKEKEVQASLIERQELLNSFNEKNKVLHELKNQTEQLKQDIHKYQLEMRSSELKKQASIARLKEEYECAFEEVKDEYAQGAVQEEEILRLKRRIEAIGPVNMAAPEEYAVLQERYNFLLTQQQDLVKAKEDLHQVIVKINQNTLENFKKTFYEVQSNFRTIYKQLFEGGEADLVLTDENNLLESGVDIIAQPPGKKFQNIALLSGGEKALTAIALLFAFFMVRPSPFCIMDEVDAPLDDANIGRYINMVRSFSSKTQFLVVTHNKRTMEMANILYGVTMEEQGVSKIISVRLQRELAATA
ncbi:MAG: chromosome segregation protein SMC [Elusimicrobia bacterium]|nr:chromosome segregation protein SMC [Candidatus Liberimonas magnetica]